MFHMRSVVSLKVCYKEGLRMQMGMDASIYAYGVQNAEVFGKQRSGEQVVLRIDFVLFLSIAEIEDVRRNVDS